MNTDDCFQLGYVIKPHGLKGEVDIFIDSDFPDSYENMESVFVKLHESLVPFFIEKIRISGEKATVKFENLHTLEEASELKSCTLHLPLEQLPKLDGNKFYFHEVTGFEVIDAQYGAIGKVEKFYDYPGQDFMAVIHKGKEILIPVNDNIITEVNRNEKHLKVTLPEGLLEIYL